MGSRLVAALVVLAGVAVVLWVGLRSNASTDSAAAAVAATAATPEVVAPQPESPVPGPTAAETPATPDAVEVPENFGPRRDLVNLDGWLNTDATTLDDFAGKVILVEMWTFGCSNCKARIPYNQTYYAQFGDENFEIVGVHAPEFSYEADVANIETALVDLGVTWPVALDTNRANFRAWQSGSTSYWPRTYVIDQNGDVRYDHIGEGEYEELRATIRHLLDHPPAPTSSS